MASSHRDEISRLELLHAAHPDGLVFPHLADAYRRAGRYSQAEGILDAGLRRHGEYSSAHVVLGRLRLDQGKRDEARAAFRQVLELDPQNQVALEYLGELAAESGRVDEAIGHFRALQRVKPDGDLDDRIEQLSRRLGSRGSADPAAGQDAAVRARGAGNGGAQAHGPHRPASPPAGSPVAPEPGEVVTETMAELYARQGLFDRAAAVYRELLDRNPSDDRLRVKLDRVEADRSAGLATPAAAHAAPAPEPRAEPGIRTYMQSLLAWQAPAPEVEADPWVHAPASPTGSPGEVTAASRPAIPEPATDAAEDPATDAAEDPAEDPWAIAPVSDDLSYAEPGAEPDGEPGAEPAPTPSVPGAGAPTGVSAMGAGPDPVFPASSQTGTLIAVTDMLVGLLEYRDPFFRGSSSLTRLLATGVAEELGLSSEQQVDLALAAVLRDLGRVALGGRLLTTGEKTETPDARRQIERHVDLALHLLEGIALPPAVRAAVRHHHERWDGAGYPDGLAGEDIPVLARVLAVVDSFAAMVSPRSYRVPMKAPDAARELLEEAGTRYDPAVVDALVQILDRRDQAKPGFVQRHHILLVNPDQPGAVVTAAKLCSVGYLAEVTADVSVARERLRRVPVSALVVSAGSADDGLVDFIRTLRADPLFSGLPVIAVGAEGVAWRVRLLESGADVCFPPGITYAELQGTLGALVRRTLKGGGDGSTPAASSDSPWLALQGDIQDFPLTWLLQVMKYDSRTAAIAIRTDEAEGVIYLRQGDAIHAQLRRGAKGEEALRQMLRWGKGRFTVQPDARPREETIRSSIMHLLLTQAVDEDHAAAGIFGAVSAEG